MVKKKKVLAYIFRNNSGVKELLVFNHRAYPEVSPQVPAGTVEVGESPELAILREVYEESGLTLQKPSFYIGEYDYYREDINEYQSRHVYAFEVDGLADKWEHIVSDGEEDKGMVFDYFWLPVEEARVNLVGNMGDYLPR